MIKHEGNDPRRPTREAAEKAKRDRVTVRLVLAIAVLSGALLMTFLARGGAWTMAG